MAKGQMSLAVIKTNDDKFLLQVQQPDPVNRVMDNHMTVHDSVESLVEAFKQKVRQQLP